MIAMVDIVFANPNHPLEYQSLSAATLVEGLNYHNSTMTPPHQGYRFLQQFDEGYAPIHAYLSAIISVMGVVANILTIIVMSRPDMRTPTNRLYAVMAFADLITMLLYSIFAIFFQIAFPASDKRNLTELRAIFMVIYADASVFVHTLSVAILVAVTVFRVLILQLPAPSSKVHCSLTRANWTAFIALLGCIFITLPNAIITSWRAELSDGVEYWEVYQREDDFSAAIAVVNFWFQAVFVKLLPCLLLTLASILILRTLQEAEARRRRLQGDKPGATGKHTRTSDPRIRNRTFMLLGLLVVFLVTEVPQGVLTLVCGIMGDAVWSSIYMPLGNLLDMLTLINAGVNFVLFVSMSSEFRAALNKQLSTWCECYARMLEEKRAEKELKRMKPVKPVSKPLPEPVPALSKTNSNGHVTDTSIVVPKSDTSTANTLVTAGKTPLSSPTESNPRKHQDLTASTTDPTIYDADEHADETFADGELVPIKARSPDRKRSALNSRASNTSSQSSRKDNAAKLSPLLTSPHEEEV